jgi:hypothetical protein
MLLLVMHNKLGNKWSELSKYLKGRTDSNIKNKWNLIKRKRINFVEESLKNKIIEIRNRYKGYNMLDYEKLLIDEFMEIIETQMEKIKSDKIKNYEKFKAIDLNEEFSLEINKNTIYIRKNDDIFKKANNLRKKLGYRSHCTKRKKVSGSHKKSGKKYIIKNVKTINNKSNKILIHLPNEENSNKIENHINNTIDTSAGHYFYSNLSYNNLLLPN